MNSLEFYNIFNWMKSVFFVKMVGRFKFRDLLTDYRLTVE